ncbi:transcriptional regulator, TetR family [delta proteobacterium NaphS2]|nr:transcriptional regulator, TetR family [delta proteobacterium NaphS2]
MSRYQCGEKNRLSLIEAAVDLFADRGLSGASVRDIVKKAGTSLSSVNYYFGGKEQLYLECIGYVMVEEFAISQLMYDVINVNPGNSQEMSGALCKFINDFFKRALSSRASQTYGRFVARVMLDVGDKENEIVNKTVPFDEFGELLIRCCPRIDLIDVNLGIFTIFTQVCNFLTARTSILDRLQKDTFDEELIERIVHFYQRAVLNAMGLFPSDNL